MHDRRDGVEEGKRILAGERPIACASAGEVSGPVATMTLSHSGGGSATSSRRISISGWPLSASVTAAEKPSRSTASAPPAGTWLASAARITSEPSRRISSCSRPTALVSRSSERNELEHTSSAKPSVLCAAVLSVGRISCSTTGTPRRGDLPGGLGAGEPAADDVNGFHVQFGHAPYLGFKLGCGNARATTDRAAALGILRRQETS